MFTSDTPAGGTHESRLEAGLRLPRARSALPGGRGHRDGAAAAWWLRALLTPPKDAPAETHPTASRLAAALLAASSFLFLLDQGRLSKMYGELARAVATGQTPSVDWTEKLVRGIWKWGPLVQWSPYYVARIFLFAVGGIVLWMLFSNATQSSRMRPPTP